MDTDRVERIASRVAGIDNSLDGMSNAKARKEVNKVIHSNYPKGIFRDESWHGPNQVWKALNSASFDWNIVKSFYTKNSDGVPESKTWKFEINFVNDRGRPTVIYGNLIASGAGTVQDPLSAYDVIVTAY